jgi:HAD superfamily hydrolase (TIGR01509 family)
MTTTAIILDIEGTLVDCVPQTLRCWRETLRAHGHDVAPDALQACSGMDGNDMLGVLLPGTADDERKAILAAQGARFERDYLPAVQPFPAAHAALQALKAAGHRLAIATDCKGAALRHYRAVLQIDPLLDGVACGEEVKEGKPDPALIREALRKLGAPAARSIMVGDTPYDAEAAVAAGAACVGLRSGGFSAHDLMRAGCVAALAGIGDLPAWMGEPRLKTGT